MSENLYTDYQKAHEDAKQLRDNSGKSVVLVKEPGYRYSVWDHDSYFALLRFMVGLTQENIDGHYNAIDSFYPASFYQPIFTDEEWDEQPIEDYEVWETRELAQAKFPGREIGEYTYNDIEDPIIHRQ